MRKFNIDKSKKIIMLCPDAEFGTAKKWPVEHWLSLAKLFREQNYSVFFLVKMKVSMSTYLVKKN